MDAAVSVRGRGSVQAARSDRAGRGRGIPALRAGARASERRIRSGDDATRGACGGHNRRAFHLCLKGRFFWSKRYEGGLKTARECFEEALRDRSAPRRSRTPASPTPIRSSASTAWCGRATRSRSRRRRSSRRWQLDARLAEAHTSLGLLELGGDWDWHGAAQRVSARDRARSGARAGAHLSVVDAGAARTTSTRRTRRPSARRTSIRCRRSSTPAPPTRSSCRAPTSAASASAKRRWKSTRNSWSRST